MSKWETISTKVSGGETEYTSRFTSGDESGVEQIQLFADETRFEGDTLYISSEAYDAFLVSVCDTTEVGTVKNVFSGEKWNVRWHERSLWEADVCKYKTNWKRDLLDDLPPWVEVRGNWGYMDEEVEE